MFLLFLKKENPVPTGSGEKFFVRSSLNYSNQSQLSIIDRTTILFCCLALLCGYVTRTSSWWNPFLSWTEGYAHSMLLNICDCIKINCKLWQNLFPYCLYLCECSRLNTETGSFQACVPTTTSNIPLHCEVRKCLQYFYLKHDEQQLVLAICRKVWLVIFVLPPSYCWFSFDLFEADV